MLGVGHDALFLAGDITFWWCLMFLHGLAINIIIIIINKDNNDDDQKSKLMSLEGSHSSKHQWHYEAAKAQK